MQRAPCSEAVVLPDSVHYHGVVARDIRFQPRHELLVVPIVAPGRTQRVHLQREAVEKGQGGSIQGDDFDGMSQGGGLRSPLTQTFRRSTGLRIHCRNDVQDLQDATPVEECKAAVVRAG